MAEASDPILAHLIRALRDVLRLPRESQAAYGTPLGQALAMHLLAHYRSSKVRLLSQSSPSLAEIAFRCGFSHQSHFTRAFHQLSGMTPTRWRERTAHSEH